MAPWLRLTLLPSSLVLLISTSISSVSSQDLNLRWPYNLPPDEKYYPEEEVLIRRDIDVQQKLQRSSPTGVRKLSGDAGEKFYLEYWGFEAGQQEEERESWNSDGHGGISWANMTMWRTTTTTTSVDPPVRVHNTHEHDSRSHFLMRRLPGWHLFSKRGFQCPAGTFACTSIDRPDSCCANGYTCQIVEESSSSEGDVGCCPDGQTCGNALSTSCASGYTSCPNNPGGGCCLPGYACYDVGCIQTSTAVVSSTTTNAGPRTTTVTSYTTITPSVSSLSTTTTTTSTTTSPTSATSVAPLISTITRTVTVTHSATLPATCSSGFQSCPASLGGGCCPTDRQCGSSNCPAVSTTSQSSGTPEPPVRPTSLTTTVETTTTTTTHSTSPTYPVTGCPTGFYACSAFYQGGCCQIGRNCDSTSCPAGGSTTVVSGSTLTIVAPTGSGISGATTTTLLTGSCAQGWATCAADVGGGCCPSGYVCGTASCNIPASATASLGVASGGSVGKQAPSNGAGATLAPPCFLPLLVLMLACSRWVLS